MDFSIGCEGWRFQTMNSTTKPSFSHPSDRFYFAATALLVLGIALRQWALGEPSFHPDEAIHTFFSGGFGSYQYDPIYHGPMLYHLVAGVFGVFGQWDYTARLVPSLLGIGLLALVLGPMRAFLGNRGALAGAAMIAVSPSVVSYSRRLLHDSLVLFLTLGAVWCFLVALQNAANTPRGRNARIGVAAFLTCFLATKANCFFIAAMLGAFYFAWRLSGGWKVAPSRAKWIPALLFALVALSSVLLPRDNGSSEAVRISEHNIFGLIAFGSCVGFGLWLLTRPVEENEAQNKREWRKTSDATTYVLALATALWLYVFLFGNGAQILGQWAQTRQFPTELLAQGSGNARGAIGKMLEYWGGQQAKPRLPGRHDYYLVLALLYELPILIAALGGIWHASKNRSTITDLLLWWSFSSWTVYALANEKVPWLLVHSVLPLALLGGIWLGQIRWKKPLLITAGALGAVFCLRGASGVNFERGGDHFEPMLYAQTPDQFRDALHETLVATRGDDRGVWMAGERQWPSVWYLRSGGPEMGKSGAPIAGTPDPGLYRAAISEELQWPIFQKAGWKGKKVDFLIWPRASWGAISLPRYARWFWTRETLPAFERNLPQNEWKISILSENGEWSSASAMIGRP
jgi:uncharacterized protein (TIGR03663 family)